MHEAYAVHHRLTFWKSQSSYMPAQPPCHTRYTLPPDPRVLIHPSLHPSEVLHNIHEDVPHTNTVIQKELQDVTLQVAAQHEYQSLHPVKNLYTCMLPACHLPLAAKQHHRTLAASAPVTDCADREPQRLLLLSTGHSDCWQQLRPTFEGPQGSRKLSRAP